MKNTMKANMKDDSKNNTTEPKRLYRSRENKIIAGVCGGIGEYFNIDPIWPRLIFVLLTILDGMGIIIYIVAWILVPGNPDQKITKKTVAEKTAERFVNRAKEKKRLNAGILIGAILVVIGIMFLLKYTFTWFNMNYVWPIILVLIGVYILWRREE